jgi:PIN domain nuclease of toxin-antitoxin system
MKIILDTHILLWWVINDRKLPDKARRLIEDPQNNIAISAVSVWEIAIKKGLGRIKIDLKELEEVIDINKFEQLPVKIQHAIELSELPLYHSDPFDRTLIAQCLTETARLLTHDEELQKYGKAAMIV